MGLEKNKDKTPKFPKFQEGGIVTKETLYLLGREDHEIPLPIGYKEHDIPISPPLFTTILPKGETKQDRIDWLFLIHNEEYDNHPLVRIIDILIIISGCFLDFLSNIGNRFIERKIEKKYVVKRKHRNKLSKKELRKLALGRIQGFGWRMAKRK